MNDRDILRHDRLDRVSTFGSENHADSLHTRLEDAPTDTPTQLAEKAALRAKFASKLTPTDFVQYLHAWLAASRVERSPQRNKDTGTPTVATTLST